MLTRTAVLLSAALVLGPLQPQLAHADTAPVAPTPATVSADALPTVQINGVVWSQVIVGDRVYATGEFTSARPAGSPAGTNETPRSNVLAYDLTTGGLITSWAPSLNAQGLAIAASPDGSTVYVAGDFTSVSGVNRFRMVALDAVTGAVRNTPNAALDARARALAVSGDTLYVGGIFTTVGSAARSRLAAFSLSTGQLLPWAPAANAEVTALTAPAGSGKVVVGGRFTKLGTAADYGLGAVDAVTGASVPFAANAIVRNAGTDASITSLTSDGNQVYGTGYTFGSGGNFEGSFAASASDGTLAWVNGCRGDTYDNAVVGGVLYNVSHAHDCSQVGGLPQTNPWTYQRAAATTTTPSVDGRVNVGGNFNGRPASELLHWLPTLEAGTYTGQTQAAWSVEANSRYVVLGGEFPRVNGVAQQGLVRFAVKESAPNKEGPQGYADLAPTFVNLAPGAVRVAWRSAWDRDNRRLDVEVLRGERLSTAEVIHRTTSDTNWWTRPVVAFTDTTAPTGASVSYRIRVTDPLGNVQVGPTVAVTTAAGTGSSSAYAGVVRADSPSSYWRLGETSGPAYDWSGVQDLTLAASTVRGASGPLVGDSNSAVTFPGNSTVPATTKTAQPAPSQYTVEAWFKTTSIFGGKIVGFGNSSTGNSSSFDRHVYMTNTGQLVHGVYNGSARTQTSAARYNDGQWHHLGASVGAAGMQLVVDGVLVARDVTVTTAQQSLNGFWRIGGDSLNGWPSKPLNSSLAGSIDEVAVYGTQLSVAQLAKHRDVARGLNSPPVASFNSTTTGLTASFDGSASSDAEGPVSSYAWSFGDGSSATGATASRTYAAAGTYQVTLTVTDAAGATASTTKAVTVAVPNTAPTASFTATSNGLTGTFDAGASSDADGTIASYAWAFGDGTTGTGVRTNRAYAAAGTYTVTLTVTDDKGAVATTTRQVVVAQPNAAPVAAFTSAAQDLVASFDGSSSTDDDGTIASYAWTFGDGTSGTGAQVQHSYAQAGTYSVTLTVTDDKGATGTASRSVTVTTPGTPAFYATDSFSRTVVDGFGNADSGGAWTTSGRAVDLSVNGGAGRIRTATAGAQNAAYLNAVSATDTEVRLALSLDKAATGGGVYVSVMGRRVASNDYRAKVRFLSTGQVTVGLARTVSGTETSLGVATLPGSFVPGQVLQVRVQVSGTGTTAMAAKVWASGSAEPTAWSVSATDTTAALQAAGSVGLVSYLSGSATNAPIVASFDDLQVGPRP